MSVKIEDLLLVTAIPIGLRKANGVRAVSGIVDTVNPSDFTRARRALVIPRRTGTGTGNGFASGGAGSNSSLRVGIRSVSASTSLYASGTLLPTTVSATGLTASGAVYAYNIKLDGVKRYLSLYMSAAVSGTFGCDVILCDWEKIPVTQQKATSPLTSKYGFNSITHIPSNP